MKIESIPLIELIEDPSNVRKHPESNMKAICGSLSKFGQQKPIVINQSNIIIAGNGTFAAAKRLGWKTIDCVRSELDNVNQIAFAIADNRTAELAEWDDVSLKQQLEVLHNDDFDIADIGFPDMSFDDDFDAKKDLTEEEVDALESSVTMSDEIEVDKEYLVIIFDDKKAFNEFNEKIQNDFNVGYWLSKHKKNPAFFRNGPNRILRGEDFLERIKK